MEASARTRARPSVGGAAGAEGDAAGAATGGATGGGAGDDPVGGSGGVRVLAPRWALVLGVLVVVAGVALRFLTRSDLWSDEALAVNIADLPLRSLRSALRQDGAPPLYYGLLHGWIRAFGTGNFGTRAMSGVFSVAALPLAWFAGAHLDRRLAAEGRFPEGGRRVAWAALLVLAASPFALRYATEARMYSMVVFWVFLGYHAVTRSLARTSVRWLAVVAAVTALVLYSHYWAFHLVAVVGLWLLAEAVFGRRRREAASTLAAVALGAAAFIPWLDVFRYQLRHTGTPWLAPATVKSGAATTAVGFAGGSKVLALGLLGLAAVAVAFRRLGAGATELDRGRKVLSGVRPEALVGGSVIALGLIVGQVQGTAFEARYAAVAFPLFVLCVATGIATLGGRQLRALALAVVVVAGFAVGARALWENRTQASQSAAVIRREGAAGDVVAFCPDSIAPDVNRLLPAGGGLAQMTFPDERSPQRIDWRDYEERVRRSDPSEFARRAVTRAGPAGSVWFVWTHGVESMAGKCEQIMRALGRLRPDHHASIEPDSDFFEKQGLIRYPPVAQG